MPDSNQDQDRDPRFTRSLLGRILAVGLFVALGTFAVVQMMNGKGEKSDAVVAGDVALDVEQGNTSATVTGDNSNAATDGFPTPIKSASIFDTAGAPPSAPPSRTAAASNSFSPSQNSNAFQPTPSPSSSSFDAGKSFAPLNAPPIVTSSKPPVQPPFGDPKSGPPTRYAQLPTGGPPIIASDNGFGPRPTAPPENNAFNSAGNAFADSANKLADNAKQGAGNIVENLKDKVPSIDVKQPPFGSQPNNSFAGTAATPKPFSPVQPKPFEPVVSKPFDTPKSPTGFGPANTGNPPTMTAPKPSGAGFAAGSPLRPASNGFSDRPTAPNDPEKDPSENSSRLQSFSGNGPTVQSRSDFPPANEPSGRQAIPAQAVSTPLPNPPGDRYATAPARTTNVPGDRQLEGVQAPALTIEKLSPREIQVNTAADFEIVVRNVGRVNAEDVQIHDQIPAGTEFLGSSPEPSSLTPDRRVSWDVGSLKSGQEKRVKLQLKPVQPGEIGSVAHVTFATQASMRTLVTKPVLEITHQTKPTVLIGSDVILDVVVANKGDGAAKSVLIQEDVPKQLEYQGGYRELEYEIGTLMPGQSKRVQLGLKAADIGRLKNLIFASAEGGLRASHEIDMEVIAPRMTASSDGPTRRFLQREVTHQFKIGNQGTAPATNIDLIARLPAGLRFVRANNQGQYNARNHAVVWSIAELGMNVDAGVELVTMPVQVGSQNIKFEAMADLNQKAAAEQELNVEHLIDVFFDIDDVVDPIEIGADTSYKIRVVNQGTQDATNVQLQVEFPVGLLPTGVEGPLQNQIQGQRIQFAPISSLKPGDQLDLLVRAKGQSAGDHRIVLNMQADGRQTPVSKEETTRVYADR